MKSGVLVDLVEASSRAHTFATFAETAFTALSRHCALARLELFVDGEHHVAGHAHREKTRVSVVPLVGGGSANDRVMLHLGAGTDAISSGDLALLGRVFVAMLRQVRTLGRVADISRSAHTKIKVLDESLKDAMLPGAIVAVAPSTQRLFGELVPIVARRDVCALIQGETGSGKELVARRIHELSPRASRAFVRVNCGAIPADLVESTLFGHEPGSFTGASRRHIGFFERADGGTLFLDEIGELGLSAQVKLLRALESGEIERVGGERAIRVDVRVIAATHRDLRRLVDAGTFREDLFYRLDVFPLHVAPLRERRSEIAPLARQILIDLAKRFGAEVLALDRRALTRLHGHSWPGNVRELRNVLERSMLLHESGPIRIELSPTVPREVTAFDQSSRRAIEAALAAADGRIYGTGGAAELLRLKPTTLVSKMKRLGVTARASRRANKRRRKDAHVVVQRA